MAPCFKSLLRSKLDSSDDGKHGLTFSTRFVLAGSFQNLSDVSVIAVFKGWNEIWTLFENLLTRKLSRKPHVLGYLRLLPLGIFPYFRSLPPRSQHGVSRCGGLALPAE